MAEERVVNGVSMGRRESGSESCFKTEVGSLRVADRTLPSKLTSSHHLRGVQSLTELWTFSI